jgi:probable phosphoglycerate mutase
VSPGRVIYLARHGETAWNREGRWQGHTDIALNDAGRAQARALGQLLRGRDIGRIHTSDLLRARETAEMAAAVLGVADIVIDRALRERSFGIFEGLTRRECEERHPDHWASYRADSTRVPPGAESHQALADRMHDAVMRAVHNRPERGAALPPGAGGGGAARPSAASGVAGWEGEPSALAPSEGPVLIVSHGGSIRALVARATGAMPPPLENVAVFRAVATQQGLTEIVLLPVA